MRRGEKERVSDRGQREREFFNVGKERGREKKRKIGKLKWVIQIMCVCVCVCVCEREKEISETWRECVCERERERMIKRECDKDRVW